MGITNYFKAEVPGGQAGQQPRAVAPPRPRRSFSEKQVYENPNLSGNLVLQVPKASYTHSRRSSISGQSISGRSVKSNASSIVDDIKHEVMVNYLYQQQNASLWVSDGSGEIEGVLLRKSRGNYLACPAQLGESQFAISCATMNFQVSPVLQCSSAMVLG